MNLDFQTLREANSSRVVRWHHPDTEQWTGADWANAMGGEVGEVAEVFAQFVSAAGKAQNTVKKIRRAETGCAAPMDPPIEELRDALGKEIADVFTYGDLLAHYFDIDVSKAVVNKYNDVSERQGFPDRLKVGINGRCYYTGEAV